MRRAASLNLQLALILFLALAVSYSLMTWLLHDRLGELRISQFAESVAAQVRQAEMSPGVATEAAGQGPSGRATGTGKPAWRDGNEGPPSESRGRRGHGRGFASSRGHEPIGRMRAALSAALGRAVELRPGFDHQQGHGVWVRLATPDKRWLWVPTPPPAIRGLESIVLIPAVGFFLVFVAGFFLVSQVNRPLRRLGDALAQVGESNAPAPLPPGGAKEIRTLTERFNEMLARLARLEVDRATMLAGVAHDLRTPLTRMQLHIELAEGPRKDAMLRDLAQLGDIIEQFRLFAGGGAAEAAEPRDLALFLEEALAGYEGRGLVLDLPPGTVAQVRPAALRRALTNLIDNALAYGAPPVTVRVLRIGLAPVIEVADCGPGIPPERMADALRPFSRLDPARGGAGHSGLGLAIVERLVRDQGGRLELSNAPSGGLVARLILKPATPAP